MRDESGRVRVIEALRVSLGPGPMTDSALARPLPLFELQPGAREVFRVGGDLAASQLVVQPPLVSVVGPVDGPRFELVVTYLLPADVPSVEFSGPLRQDTVWLEVDRATVRGRAGRGLSEVEGGGSEARPLRRYRALELAPGVAVRIEIATGRPDWRQRVAVLTATALAALAAGFTLWRRGAGNAASGPDPTGEVRTDARY